MKRNVIWRMSALTCIGDFRTLAIRFRRKHSQIFNPHYSFKIAAVFFISVLIAYSAPSFAQNSDQTQKTTRVSGAVTFTTKGISTIPSFTLGKPAVTFDLSVSRGKFSFEPQLRFAVFEGKPWTFIFWGRYKLVSNDKLSVIVGGHPAFSFKNKTYLVGGTSTQTMVVKRYLAGDLAPLFNLSKKISIGPYYLYSHGVENDIVKNTHFISARVNFTNIALGEQYFIKLSPQIYYLKTDREDGYYYNASLSLVKKNFPLSLSSLFNKTIHSNVQGSKDFIWNISLIYSFSKRYIAVK